LENRTRRAGLKQAGFGRVGATVRVAWEVKTNMLLVAINGAKLMPLIHKGVVPGSTVGAGLFPAISGGGGCQVRWNLGQQRFRYELPQEYLPWASANRGDQNRTDGVQGNLAVTCLSAVHPPSFPFSTPSVRAIWLDPSILHSRSAAELLRHNKVVTMA
jgi:hypothetical protein